MSEEWLEEKLRERQAVGTLRELTITKNKIDFVSNDYLGLARSSELNKKITQRFQSLDHPLNGSTGSRLLAGNSELAEQVEAELSVVFKSEKTLLFSSGYMANIAVLSCLPQQGDTILYDELVHACMHDGMRLSRATRISFLHNNLLDLEKKIKAAQGKIFIAVESVYSMDGDFCPLKDLTTFADRYGVYIIVDEAHSTGSYGEKGAGLAVSLNIESKIFARIYTFGKAMGVHGACVAGSKKLIQFLINHARTFIYTTAMSPHSIVSIQGAFEYLHLHPQLQSQLSHKTNFFLEAIKKTGLQKIESTSAIQSIMIQGNAEVLAFAKQLQKNGFDCRAIRTPTVKPGAERIRICLHEFNSEKEITDLVNCLLRC